MKNGVRYLDGLASLRFFAAIFVVLFHLRAFTGPYHNPIQSSYIRVFYWGFSGVSIFYVLSGFVISYANESWKGWKTYLIGRVTRIYPSHWIVLFTFALLSLIALFQQSGMTLDTALKVLTNLTLVQSWIPNPRYFFSLNDVSWSLSVEMFFYVSFLLLRLLKDRYIYILSVVSYLILVIAALEFRHRWGTYIYWGFNVNPLARLPEFLAGMSIYRLYKSGNLVRLWLPRFNFPLIFIAMIAALALTNFIPYPEFGFSGSFTYSIVPLPFAVLMIVTLLDERANTYMRNKTLVLLGESSFALYLIHKPIVILVAAFLQDHREINGAVTSALLVLFAVLFVLISVAFYKFIETPITKYLKGYLTKDLHESAK